MLLFCKKINVEVSIYLVLTPTFIIEPKKADVHTSARARQSEYPMRATGASAASLDIQPDTSGETSISEYKKCSNPI